MDLTPEALPPEYRFVLSAKMDQAHESGDAALVTAGVLATGLVVALRLLHAPVPTIALLAVPMMLSGIVGYAFCRRRASALRADLDDATIVVGSAHAKLVRFEGSAEGSYALTLPHRRVGAFSRSAGLRSTLIRPDSGTFSGSFAFAPHSGQLLRLNDRSGRQIFDAAATELDETFDFSELSSV